MSDIAMEIDMPDIDQFDRDDTPVLFGPDDSAQPSPEPSASLESPDTPGPSNSPTLSNDIDDQRDSEDDDQPQQPGPNHLFRGDIKKYDSTTLIILDATETGHVYGHEADESIHKHNTRLIEIAFREISDFDIIKICLPQGSTEDHFKIAVNNILSYKTEKDLLIFHYHGSAGGVEKGYKWRFEGHPRNINAYNFIDKLCNSAPDSMLLLDCYVHTKFFNMWTLNTGAVEVVTLKTKIQDGAGRMIHADDGYVTEGVCRNLKKYLKRILSFDEFKVARRSRQSIPQIWGRDYVIKDKSERIWFSRSGKDRSELCLRFMINPVRTWQTDKLVFESYCWGPAPPPPIQFLPPAEVGEDEGFGEMEESESVVDGEDGGANEDRGDGDEGVEDVGVGGGYDGNVNVEGVEMDEDDGLFVEDGNALDQRGRRD